MSKNEFLTMQNRLQSLEAEQAEHEMAVEEAKQRRLTEEQMKRKEEQILHERQEVHQQRQDRDLRVVEKGIQRAIRALGEEDDLASAYRYRQLMENYQGACGRGPPNWKIAAYDTDSIAFTEASKDSMKRDIGKLKRLLQALEDEEWEWHREQMGQGCMDACPAPLAAGTPKAGGLQSSAGGGATAPAAGGGPSRRPPDSLTRDLQRLRATLEMLEEDHVRSESDVARQQEVQWQASADHVRYLDMARHRAANRRPSEWSLQRQASEEAQHRELERSAGRGPSPPHDAPAKPEPRAAILVLQELVAF
eukprot:EG_transcript_18266